MTQESDLLENGLLIVTGSNLRAERADRPLAYRLKSTIEDVFDTESDHHTVVVMSDLWYLNTASLQSLPMISVGRPGINAASAYLCKRLPNALLIDGVLAIQMDVHLEDLRASVWGSNHEHTISALDIFIEKGYLHRFLEAMALRQF
jgi:hypothetical protein